MEEKKVIRQDLLLKPPTDIAELLSHLSEKQATELLHRLYSAQLNREPSLKGSWYGEKTHAYLEGLEPTAL
jgi:hypothetical protein